MNRTALASSLLLCATAIPSVHAAVAPAAPAPPSDEIVPLKKAKLFIFEDFESADAGKIPKGWTSKGSVEVVDDVAHSGHHSLRLNVVRLRNHEQDAEAMHENMAPRSPRVSSR